MRDMDDGGRRLARPAGQQAEIGGAGQQQCFGMPGAQGQKLGERARCMEAAVEARRSGRVSAAAARARRQGPRPWSWRRRSADSRCSGRDCRPARRGWCRGRPSRRPRRRRRPTSRSPGCRSRIAWRPTRPSPPARRGARRPSPCRPSTVRTAWPSICPSRAMQEFIASRWPSARSSTTVQAPQSPSAQPSLVPRSPAMLAQPVEQRRHRRDAVELHRLVVQDKTDAVRHANDCDRGVLHAQAALLHCRPAHDALRMPQQEAKKWIPTGSATPPSSSDRSFPGPTARGSRCGSAPTSSTTSTSPPRCGCAIPGRACRIPTCWAMAAVTTATASACGACSRSWTSTASAAPCRCRCR